MLEIIANAKVNLFLEITGKLPNGYHTVDTVMQSVSLSDVLKIELLSKNDGIKLVCSDPDIPTDERNIAYKTAQAFINAVDASCGAKIDVLKRIPSQAGMGGGSADGAAVLVGLNRLLGDPLTPAELKRIATKYGADIPFCIDGGTQCLGGIGTDLVESLASPELCMVIAKPRVGISTPAAYRFLDTMHNDFAGHNPIQPELLLQKLRSSKHDNISLHMYNRFEETLEVLCVESLEIIAFLKSMGCEALLSGSGTAVFGIAEGKKQALKLADCLNNKFSDCFVFVCETAQCGCLL